MFAFIIGSCLGSFYYCMACRLPQGESLIAPPSQCPNCHQRLKIKDLVPIVSVLFLRFRCRYCKAKIPWSSLCAEVVFGFMFVKITNLPIFSQQLLAFCWLSCAFILSFTDILYLILDPFVFFSGSGLLWLLAFCTGLTFYPMHFIVLLLLCIVGHFSSQHYLGQGDLLLACAWFPWLTLEQISMLLVVASGSGILYLLLKYCLCHQPFAPIPFIPFMTLGLYISYFW